MAVSGAGGWTPSRSVTIRNGHLAIGSIWQNKPPAVVVDLDQAANLLRHDPAAIVEVDTRGDNLVRLRNYLAQTGHIKRTA